MKFHFQYSDPNDSEKFQRCKVLVENKHSSATHRNHVGKRSTPIRIRLKLDAKLPTRRPTKVLILYRNSVNNLLDDLLKNEILKLIVSTPHEKLLF